MNITKEPDSRFFEYLDYYQKEEGYLLSFNFNKNKETGIKKIEYKGKHIIETVSINNNRKGKNYV